MASRHVLVLPFDQSTYPDPSPVLPVIYRTLVHLPGSITHFHVLFITPGTIDQLYPKLKAEPVSAWDDFQTFLAEVYATLAAGQWTSGKILLDVEVIFGGEPGLATVASGATVLEGSFCVFRQQCITIAEANTRLRGFG